MSCHLLDIGCHLQSAAWEWWADIGMINKVLIVGGLLLFVLSAVRGVLAIIHKVGGWPAVIGAVLAILGLVLALLPQPPKASAPVEDQPAPRKPKPPFQFGVDRTQAKPKRKTLQDMLGGLR